MRKGCQHLTLNVPMASSIFNGAGSLVLHGAIIYVIISFSNDSLPSFTYHGFTHGFTMVQLACSVLRQALVDTKQPSSERSAARSEARWAAAKSLD